MTTPVEPTPRANAAYPLHTEAKIAEVVTACERYGDRAIVALAGVPGTGKSFIGSIAAQRHAGEPLRVQEIQFHQSFSYEEFVEGMRIQEDGSVEPVNGVFLDWNETAKNDTGKRYVLLIEELTRANLSAVLGELMTYIEYRDRNFHPVYSRAPHQVSPQLTILATYNPTDRSAIDIDAALLRRMRIIQCPPSPDQLDEMLTAQGRSVPRHVIDKLKALFTSCEADPRYKHAFPFGHGIFADVREEADLYPLWSERIEHILYRPLVAPQTFAEKIKDLYPWQRNAAYRLPAPAAPGVAAGADIGAATPAVPETGGMS